MLYAIHLQERDHGPPSWIITTLDADGHRDQGRTRGGCYYHAYHEHIARAHAQAMYPTATEITPAEMLDRLEAAGHKVKRPRRRPWWRPPAADEEEDSAWPLEKKR